MIVRRSYAALVCAFLLSCGRSDSNPVRVPDAPTGVGASPGDAKAIVTWTPPTSNGGSAISSNTVASSPGPVTVTVGGSATMATVPGLTNGTSYVFTVSAANSTGSGPPSAPSAPVTPRTVPGAPAITSVTPGDGRVIVGWSPPTSDGGSAITAYTVTSSPGGATVTVLGALTSAVVSGLVNGTAYTFTVFATNAAGNGAVSTTSPAATPRAVPGAPTSVTATAGDGQAVVSWGPAANNGAAITSYTVTSTPGGVTVPTPDGSSTSATLTGLVNGTSYTFTVYATNAAGNGPTSSPSNTVTPFGKPGAPAITSAVPDDGQAVITWTAAFPNGSAITSYTVSSSPPVLPAKTVNGNTTTTTVSGLINGTGYTFTVVATNAAGNGPPSVASASVVPFGRPTAPTGVTAVKGNAQAVVTWTAALSNGSAITSYLVTSSPGGQTATTLDGTTTTATVSGLVNGTSYTFTVTATNAAGAGASSLPSNSVTPSTVPGSPTSVSAVTGNLQATVSWIAPSSNGGSSITGYRIVSTPGNVTVTAAGNATSAIVTPLVNGTPYTFVVYAVNANGDSLPSAPSNSVTPSTVPDAPTAVSATPGDGQATVTWTAPTNTGGSPITSYTIIATPVTSTSIFPISVAPGGRYLLDSYLRPLPILGRTAWFVLSLGVTDFQTFVDDTAAKGYDAIEFHVVNHDARGNNPPFNGNGDLPFTITLGGTAWNGSLTYGNIFTDAPDFTKPNEPYWAHVDALLSYCESKGIMVFLFPAYTGYQGSAQGWMQEMLANGTAKMQSYGTFIAQRYRNQKNIVWMMGGDFGTADPFSQPQTDVEAAMLNGMNSVTGQQSTQFSAEWSSESICTDQVTFGSNCTLNGSYSWSGDVSTQSLRAYNGPAPARPAFLLEEPYDEEGPDGDSVNPHATQPVRRFQWLGWLSSIGGYISGNGYIWPFAPGIWTAHLNTPGAQDMARLNAFIASVPWWTLVPSGLNGMKTLVIANGFQSWQAEYVAAAAAPVGNLLVAYIPPAHPGSITVDMTAMSAPARARWLDPTSGAYQPDATPSVSNSGPHDFTPPGANSAGASDWVLVLDVP
jgi:hypothetical protein